MKAGTEIEKKEIGDEKNRDAKVLEWLLQVLIDGGLFCHSDYDC